RRRKGCRQVIRGSVFKNLNAESAEIAEKNKNKNFFCSAFSAISAFKINLSEVGFELGEGGIEVFGDDPGIGQGGHKICVAVPSRQKVKVIVVGDSGARRPAKIHSHVESIRTIDFAKRANGSLHQPHHL